MLQLFLFLHVLGAIVIFGPTFTFPIIASQARKSPQHGHFAAELSHVIESRLLIPGMAVQATTGIALILIIGADITNASYRWLIAATTIYVIAVAYSLLVQAPAVAKLVQLSAGGPPAGAPPAGAPVGPPPELLATSQKLQRGGMLLTVLLVLIVILMVTKPGV